MSNQKPLSADQVRARLRLRGVTVTRWAKEHNFPRAAVYRVLGGQFKGRFGQAHQIAVELGMKVPDADQSSDLTGDRNTQQREAA